MNIDLKKIQNIYFVGIKGVAMTALAVISYEMGKNVWGSDIKEEFPTKSILSKKKIKILAGFSPGNISKNIDLMIYTGAHNGRNNIEVNTALKLKIPVLAHGQALGLFMKGKIGISVAGSHGKTTTSAIISHILEKIGLDPSYAIGCGEILSLNAPGHFGKGKYFVAEADEYVTDPKFDNTPRFLWQYPKALVITNVDFDHPDVYANLSEIQSAFIKFCSNVDKNGFVVINQDDINTQIIKKSIQRQVFSFGFTKNADYFITNVKLLEQKTSFDIFYKNKLIGNFSILIPGLHNVANMTAAIITLINLGIQVNKIQPTLLSFIGTKRRFEFITEKNNILFYDDYAHHPAEIKTTIAAFKNKFPKRRIILIFQPHTYSRTQRLFSEFATCFTNTDVLILTDIYASAREKPVKEISGKKLFAEIKKHQSNIFYEKNLDKVLNWLQNNVQPNDLVVTMGAGNIYSWIEKIKTKL